MARATRPDPRKETSSAPAAAGSINPQQWKLIALAVSLFIVLLVALFVNWSVDQLMRGDAKKQQDSQQKQLQDMQSKLQEDLQRRQIASDNRVKLEMKNTLNQFMNILGYDAIELNNTIYAYGPENLTDRNLAKKAETARAFGLKVIEFTTHVDGFEEYVNQSLDDIRRIAGGDAGNVTAAFTSLDETKAQYRLLAGYIAKDLDTFAGSNPVRRGTIAPAISVLNSTTLAK